MFAEEKMTIDERYNYLRQMKKRYQKVGRGEKVSCWMGWERWRDSSLERYPR